MSVGVNGPSHLRARPWAAPLVTSVYVALVTVLFPSLQQIAPPDAKAAAAAVVAVAIVGGLLLPRLDGVGRQVVITAFVTACVAAWALERRVLVGHRLDPWLGACGSVGWALFATTWAQGRPWRDRPDTNLGSRPSGRQRAPAQDVAESDRSPTGEGTGGASSHVGDPGLSRGLEPRARLPRISLVVGSIGTFAGGGLLLVPWWIPDRNRALVGHGIALVAASLAATISLRLASSLATPSAAEQAFGRSPRHAHGVLWRARWAFVALAVAVAIGVAYIAR